MTDVHEPDIRSYNMSQIKGKDTKPEILVRKYLFNKGYRYRLHEKRLPGKPDLVLPKHKTVIFIHGCFWHAHEGCKYFVIPKTRTEWWTDKLMKNRDRDEISFNKIRDKGWKVIVVWECELKPERIKNTFDNLIKELNAS